MSLGGFLGPGVPNLPRSSGTTWFSLGSVRINSGDTVAAGNELTLGGKHPASTVSLVSGANITAGISMSRWQIPIPSPFRSRARAIPSRRESTARFHQIIPSSPLSIRADHRHATRRSFGVHCGSYDSRSTSAPWE